MTTSTLHAKLNKVKNVAEFARHAKIPRKTIDRIAKSADWTPRPTTEAALLAALKSYKGDLA